MILEEYSFTFRGKQVDISIEENPYRFKISFLNEGMKEEIVFKTMWPQFLGKRIECDYFVQRINTITNKVENSRTGVFTVTPEEFDVFFHSPTGPMPVGIFLARNFINGMTFEEKETLGVRFFAPMLQPTQPVTADTAIVAASEGLSDGSVTITPIDGIAPFEYSLNDSIPQVGNVFENLIAGEHALKIIDSNGTYLAITITV